MIFFDASGLLLKGIMCNISALTNLKMTTFLIYIMMSCVLTLTAKPREKHFFLIACQWCHPPSPRDNRENILKPGTLTHFILHRHRNTIHVAVPSMAIGDL